MRRVLMARAGEGNDTGMEVGHRDRGGAGAGRAAAALASSEREAAHGRLRQPGVQADRAGS